MKKIYTYLIIPALFFSLSSCTNDKEELLQKKEDPKSECDTINVTYSGAVTTIFKNNCYICHSGNSPSAGIALDKYNSTLVQVNNKKLLGAIKHENGFQPMPQGAAKLTNCQIQQIEAWINAGAKDN